MSHEGGRLMNTSMPILVVDDSQTMRSIILGYLNGLDYTEVDFAEDGQSGLEKIRQKQYALVISDWEMPQIPGSNS